MKAKALQLGKAMSAALFVLLLVAVSTKNTLAQNQVATLQHGDEVSAYYGPTAFVQAHNNATDGDIITLSSGSFTAPSEITKAITLRGEGAVTDTATGSYPTIFAGEVRFNVANDSIPVNVEGILFSNKMVYRELNNPIFTRCNFNEINYYSDYFSMVNAQFVNCIINTFYFNRAYSSTLFNSVVWNPNNISSSQNVILYNSIMRNGNYGGISANNSIIIKSGQYSPGSTCTFNNCIGINVYDSYSPFGSGYTNNCVAYSSYGDVFESFEGDFYLEEPFILKDEIATGFLGNDGTQVGIHGGVMPYTSVPGYMLRTQVNVPNHSNIDGTLNVEIEIIDEGE